MRTDCLFWIASMSKPMTATALMMLVDEGKVKLDDPVEKYLPEFQGQMVAAEHEHRSRAAEEAGRIRSRFASFSATPAACRSCRRIERKIDTLPLRRSVLSYAMTPLSTEPGTQVRLQQRRHQHRRPDHRSRQRHALRGVHG